jgi:hypothetical protein
VVGATVTLGAYSGTTNGSGDFIITDIPAGASGNLIPTLTNYIFTPTSLSISAMSGNLTGQNFALDYITWKLQPDISSGIDTCIYAHTPDYNFGSSAPQFRTGCGSTGGYIFRGMIKIPIVTLPAGKTLLTAVLSMMAREEQSAVDYTTGVHRSLVAWYSGNKDNAALDAGVDGSTWNYRNNNGAVAWAGGAGGASSADWAATPTDSQLITSVPTWFNWNVLPDVQAWYEASATNYGWWMICTGEGTVTSRKGFWPCEWSTTDPTLVPKLVVTYR